MPTCLPSHLSDQALERDLSTVVSQERGATAKVLAYIAEFDARKLYLPAAHPSMYSYCVHVLHLSEEAVADGRLHLSAVVMLAPHLNEKTADELLAAAAHKTKSEIEHLLAQRFPRPDLPTRIQPLSPVSTPALEQPAPGRVEELSTAELATERSALERIEAPIPRPKVAPLAPERFGLQGTMSRSMHDKLEYAQTLLSHRMPTANVMDVLERALDSLIRELQKSKFAATEHQRSTAEGRYVPTQVKRAVWERDGGQCSFVSKAGQRCLARDFLEFDHIDEVARGGQATVERMRLRCRAHNQYTAECTFGTEFMNRKRREAAARQDDDSDVIRCLRTLGCRADEARRLVLFGSCPT